MRAPLVAVLLTAAVASAQPKSADVVAAAEALQSARSKFAEAMRAAEADAPTAAELDAALAAAEALKAAIDAGAAQEPNDLEYARAALAARKELREKRAFLESRRAKLAIFDRRRQLDAALATLREKAKPVSAPEPSSSDFEAARAAVAEVKQLADGSRAFAPKDAGFASFLAQVDAEVGRLEKAIDEKWAQVEGKRHMARVEEARQAFTQAMSVLSAASSDEQFSAADEAGKALARLLDEGQVLEGRDRAYGAYAAKTRDELAAAKKKADELWSQTGVTRLKAEIEPTAKDLASAVKTLRARRLSEDQLAEARTVAIIARKLLEKYDAEARRSAEFARYVAQVRANLLEVEAQLELEALDAAVKELRQALLKLEKKMPGDDDFSVASSALTVLEKTIASSDARNPFLSKQLADAQAWQREGRKTIAKRRLEVDVAAQQEKVEAARKRAADLISDFAKAESGEEQFKEATLAVANITTVLDGGKALIEKDKTYAWYDREVRRRVGELEKKLATRRLQLDALAAKHALYEAIATVKAALDRAREPGSTDADVEAAQKAIEAANALLEAKAQLEAQAGSYASAAEKGRNELSRSLEKLELARAERDVRRRTVDAYAQGMKAFSAAQASQDMRVQKREYERAAASFKTCKEEGAKLLESFGNLPVLVGGQPGTVKDVVSQCGPRLDETMAAIRPLAGLIAFEDGPKKAYELALQLLEQGKRQEALAQFDECTATGVTLGVRNPEMKEGKFSVAGKQVTLSELTSACTRHSRELLGKK